jgi:hypothetical protein
MEDFSLLSKLDRVAAPPDFERKMMSQLSARRKALPQMRRALAFRYSLASAAAALLVCFVMVNMFVLQKGPLSESAGQTAQGALSSRDFMPISEPVKYSPEIRRASYEPKTAYILEQVSDASNVLIKY